ncbi:MAG: iron-containing alcohol dehydrogenase [Candidatus Poribacteria bacterium]|nr:iron-containing alcohol dehydrogenase [Candidatus Poribacteria bacterium]
MEKSGRGWSHGSRMKPAAEYDIRYGSGLLRNESAAWPRYLVVSTPSAYRTAQPYLSQEPAGVAYAAWLDFSYQQELSNSLPDDAELVVGLGGGLALDAAKYVALYKDLPLIMAPTIVSTGAIIHGVVAKWEGRKIIGSLDDWPWVDCDHVLVDDDVVLAAPYYLNTAGLGDILCGYAGIAEWQWRSRNGLTPPCDEAVIAAVSEHHEKIAGGFEKTLDTHGDLTANSVHHIMRCMQERDARTLQQPGTESGDHPFWLALELVNDKGWIHGEMVALGAIIISWQCDAQPETLIERLDRCKVRRRPTEIGLSREELRKGLAFVPGYMAERNIDSILRHKPVTASQFDALWNFLETC